MPNYILEMKALSRWHMRDRQRLVALDSVSLALRAGEIAALYGPSGSGKSTLLNLVATLDRPSGGEIHFEGKRIDCFDAGEAERFRSTRLGIVFQSFNLIPTLSALENVELALIPTIRNAGERRRLASAMLARVGLADRVHHWPAQLSGGQQQRVGVARALVRKPALVLADEPSANLDSQSARNLFDLMHELAAEYTTTFMIATHDHRLIERTTRVITLADGRLVQ